MKTSLPFPLFFALLVVAQSHCTYANTTNAGTLASFLLSTCNSPTVIACGDMVSGNTASGQSNIDEYGAALSTGPELVYELMPTADVDALIELTNLAADVDLFVFTDCNDPKNTTIASSRKGGINPEDITIGLTNGVTYFISVDGFSGNTSTFDLSVTCTTIETPCNVSGAFFEDFENGQPVGWTFGVTGTSATAVWNFDADDIGDAGNSTPNPGSGNWATYDDDDAGNSGDNNVATATTPTLDLSALSDIVLSFDYAYRELNDESVTLSITDGTMTFYWNGSVWTSTVTPWLTIASESGTFSQLIPAILNKTTISVTLEYNDVDAAWAWGFGFDNFGLCGSSGSSCPSTLMVNDTPIANGTYSATNTLTSTGTVAPSNTVIFEAGQSITLQTGFHAQAGSNFTARIQACAATVNALIEKRSIPSASTNTITIFPNPFRDQSNVAIHLAESAEVQINLFDLSGKHIGTVTEAQVLPSGTHYFELNTYFSNTGLYLLTVRIGHQIETIKISRID
ncbi:MAG: T9SS type A sorting domain-containing protein [Bacteroidota bacterium]